MIQIAKASSLPLNPLPKPPDMVTRQFDLRTLTAFGSPLHGDALFGQLCWIIRNRFGEARLNELLIGYTEGHPFMVVSDALPAGFIPRPVLPSGYFEKLGPDDKQKEIKKRVWLSLADLPQPVARWAKLALPEIKLISPPPCRGRAGEGVEAGTSTSLPFRAEHAQPHNSINRATQTTGEGGFAPFSSEQIWYHPAAQLTVYIVLDEQRLSAEELSQCVKILGNTGFARDASAGLGKFENIAEKAVELPAQANANAWLTLAACAPQGQAWDAGKSFYQVMTRFGRHGDVAAISEHPFKNPILLAKAGAVLTPQNFESRQFVGNGLGGDGKISKAIPQTVHQGYAPVIGIRLGLA